VVNPIMKGNWSTRAPSEQEVVVVRRNGKIDLAQASNRIHVQGMPAGCAVSR
jgi:hypothetical protein